MWQACPRKQSMCYHHMSCHAFRYKHSLPGIEALHYIATVQYIATCLHACMLRALFFVKQQRQFFKRQLIPLRRLCQASPCIHLQVHWVTHVCCGECRYFVTSYGMQPRTLYSYCKPNSKWHGYGHTRICVYIVTWSKIICVSIGFIKWCDCRTAIRGKAGV